MGNKGREAKVVTFSRSNKIMKTHFKRTDCFQERKNAKCSHLGLENEKSQRQTSDTLHQNNDNRTGEGVCDTAITELSHGQMGDTSHSVLQTCYSLINDLRKLLMEHTL